LLAIVGRGWDGPRRGRGEQAPAEVELGGAMAIGEEAVVADAMEAVGEGMQQEAADELVDLQGHDLGLVVMAIIFPAEGDLIVVDIDEAAVGDGDAMGVAPEIGQDLLWTAERRLGIDDPFDLAHLADEPSEGFWLREMGEVAEQNEGAGLEGGLQAFEEEPSIEAR